MQWCGALRRIYNGEMVGDCWPYTSGSEHTVLEWMQALADRISRCDTLAVDTDLDDGCKTYGEVFCYKRDGSSTRMLEAHRVVDGILLYVCRLAPVAVYGSTTRCTYTDGCQALGSLDVADLGSLPKGDWSEEVAAILEALAEPGLSIPDPELLALPLPADLRLESLFGEPPYSVFHLLFNYMD